MPDLVAGRCGSAAGQQGGRVCYCERVERPVLEQGGLNLLL